MWQKRSICYFHELEGQIDVNLVNNGITSVAFDRELCKGQRTWGIPIMFLALTWLLKGESTILSIKSSTSSLRRYNMRCRVAIWDNSCLELSNELHKGMTKSRMCATRMDRDLMINHICEFISAKWTINFQWTTQGTKHSRHNLNCNK